MKSRVTNVKLWDANSNFISILIREKWVCTAKVSWYFGKGTQRLLDLNLKEVHFWGKRWEQDETGIDMETKRLTKRSRWVSTGMSLQDRGMLIYSLSFYSCTLTFVYLNFIAFIKILYLSKLSMFIFACQYL